MTGWVWARGLGDPDVHIRETQDGIPVVYLVEGAMAGFALCGAWVVADVTAEERAQSPVCARCADLAAAIDRGEEPEPGWSARQ